MAQSLQGKPVKLFAVVEKEANGRWHECGTGRSDCEIGLVNNQTEQRQSPSKAHQIGATARLQILVEIYNIFDEGFDCGNDLSVRWDFGKWRKKENGCDSKELINLFLLTLPCRLESVQAGTLA